jgi:hypothetical protein
MQEGAVTSDRAMGDSALWFGLLAANLAGGCFGLWALLNTSYSPLSYTWSVTAPDVLEYLWLMAAVVAAVLFLTVARREAAAWKALGYASLPLGLCGLAAVLTGRPGDGVPLWVLMPYAGAFGWLVLRGTPQLWPAHPPLTAQATMPPVWRTPSGRWAAAILLGMAGYYGWQQMQAYNLLAYGFQDSGHIARLMFNSWNHPGDAFLQAYHEKPRFFDHFEPGIIPFVLLWPLCPNMLLVVILQLVAVLGTAIPLYWLGRQCFHDDRCALLLVLIWLVYPSSSLVIDDVSYGFRWGSFFLPLFTLALACWRAGKWRWALGLLV